TRSKRDWSSDVCSSDLLAARRISPVASATFLTTMLDFTDPGDIGVYISRESLAAREPLLRAGTRVQGSELASAFASLRANELVRSEERRVGKECRRGRV